MKSSSTPLWSKLSAICLLVLGVYACGVQPAPSPLLVMSFNIRYDNPDDAPNDWTHRKDSLAALIRTYSPDVLGTQEVLHQQLTDLKERLPEYEAYGVGRLDGRQQGEYAAILYRRDRFSVEDAGYFWLSDQPEVAGSMGWDAACERIATWLILQDEKTSRRIFLLNTHLDHVGGEARKRSAELIKSRLNRLAQGLPVIVMGDFNAAPTDPIYRMMTDETDPLSLRDTRLEVKQPEGEEGTFHNFARLVASDRPRIDYILKNQYLETLHQEHIATDRGAVCLSDHHAVLARLVYR